MDRISDHTVAMNKLLPKEEALRQTATEVAERHKTALSAVGLTLSDPEVEVWKEEPVSRTSEFRICVLREGDVEDVLEFPLFRDGLQIPTEPEIILWLDEQISAMLK